MSSLDWMRQRRGQAGTPRNRRADAWRGGAVVSILLLVLLSALPGQTAEPALLTAGSSAVSGVWISTWPMVAHRGTQTATALYNGTVLVAGGYNNPTGDLASAEVYHPRTGRFTPTGSLTYAREQHTATLLRNGLVLIAGGGECE